MTNKCFIRVLLTLCLGFSTLANANNTLILDTLYEQGTTFISIDSLAGRSASAFSVYKMMAKTDGSHPKTHAFAMLLDNATKKQVEALIRKGDSLAADRLKLEYLSLQYEAGVEPSAWAAIKQDFSTTANTTQSPVSTPKVAPAELTAKNQLSSRQVRTLIANTKTYLKSRQFFMPENRNAFHNIKRVLSDDPKNEKAIEQYFSLMEKVQDEVNDLLEEGEAGKAVSLTEQGLAVLPGNALLVTLNNRAQGLKNFEAHLKSLHDPNEYMPELKSSTRNALISNGKVYLGRKQFFQPDGANAYAKFARVLSSEPDNSKALSGMFKLIQEVDEEISALVEDGKIQQAQSLMEQGLVYIPDQLGWQARLVELEALQTLSRSRVAYAQQNYSTTLSSRNQKALLSNAKSYIRSGNYFGATNKNANNAIHRALAADPESTKVIRMFDDLIEGVNKTAVKLAEDGELNKAASLVNQALTFHSGHPALVIMGSNLNSLVSVIQ